MAALRDSAQQIAEYDVDVLYVSLDSPEKNAEFALSLGTEIPVLSDPKGETARRYGVLKLGGLYANRWIFYVGSDGRLLEIDKDVRPAERRGRYAPNARSAWLRESVPHRRGGGLSLNAERRDERSRSKEVSSP